VPLYEYSCPQCGRFELIRKFSDRPLKACPTCGKAVQKLPSAPAIQFKGTGWYITDYSRKSSGGDAGSKDAGAKGEGSKDAGSKGEGGTGSSSAPSAASDTASSGSSSKETTGSKGSEKPAAKSSEKK
jgi:putative FmdB family regulatory protein